MADNWFLRIDSETFGPKTRECMIEWARLGKILPGHKISNDNEIWQDVTEVPFLDMRWGIDIGDGIERGPFNREAAQSLLSSGRLPAGSKLIEVKPPWETEEEPTEETPVEEAPAEETHSEVIAASQDDEEKRELENKIRELSDELKRMPPTAHLAADAQTALYALMRDEADDLQATLEAEKKEMEEAQLYWRKRSERLIARRQELLKWVGEDAASMTRRALNVYPEDPRTVYLRQELDALRMLQERSAAEMEQQIRDLSGKLRDKEAEVRRLTQQTSDVAVLYRQLRETNERLQLREKELMEERQKAEIYHRQQEAAQQVLLARISSLELGTPGATHQSREARSVRLAPWMGLQK